MVAGDQALVDVSVGSAAAVLVTSQAAEKIYRSTGADCRVSTRLAVGQGGWLEWCPQETILFERARLRRTLRLDLADGARAMLGEILVFGRQASGEDTRAGFLLDRIEVRRDGVLGWQDCLRLDGAYAAVLALRPGWAVRALRPRSSMRRPTPGGCSTAPASGCRPRASGRRRRWSTACWSRAFWPSRRLRCGALSRCSGPASAPKRPACRRCCRASGTFEGTPCT